MKSHDNRSRLKLILASLCLGLGVTATAAFADDWSEANDKLRRAQEELNKDTRQYNEARANGSRKGMENEAREIQKDREEIARRRADVNSMRQTYGIDRGYGRYDPWGRYDDRGWDGPGRNGRGWAWGHHKNDRDDWWHRDSDHQERQDAWRELRNDQRELQKDHQELQDAWRRGDRRGVENERREIHQDHREIQSDRNRLGDIYGR
jgi:uncharacterized protein YlxW (UPF0749 family)